MSQWTTIPAEQLTQLNQETLYAVIESFVLRDGTDYGLEEYSLARKVEQVYRQLLIGEVLLVYDHFSDSCQLITKVDYLRYQSNQVADSGSEYSDE